jgi:regulator of RNase E activity RraA
MALFKSRPMIVDKKTNQENIAALKLLDTCLVSSAIDYLQLRLANEGYSNSSIRCRIDGMGPLVGHAVTATIRTAATPLRGRRIPERRELWQYALTIPEPRILVLEDVDHPPGAGAFIDFERVTIAMRLGCIGAITDGAIRELPRIKPLGFQLFSRSLSVARAYSHVAEVGVPVEIGNLAIKPGDLLHCDMHGLLLIPPEAGSRIPQAAFEVLKVQRRITDLCRASDFKLEDLWEKLKILEDGPDTE